MQAGASLLPDQVVGVEGFEPTVTGSEPVALPLGDTPVVTQQQELQDRTQ